MGERALRVVLDHVVEHGDAAETSYLEVKRDIDLAKPAGFTKVAKFLLGVANRAPTVAARHFQGYTVMVLGAARGETPGLPTGTEVHEIEDRLRPYLGAAFPTFEFGRLPAGSGREVLFVIGTPPVQGQPPYPCRKNYSGSDPKENLTDGAIYVRGQSNTRPANAGEVDALVERARTSSTRPDVDLALEVQGPVQPVGRLDQLMDALYEHTAQEFRDALAEPADPRPAPLRMTYPFDARPLSVAQRRDRLERWIVDREAHMARGRAHLLGVALTGMSLAVISHGRFLAGPQLTVVFHGCELVEHLEPEDFDPQVLVEPVLGRREDPYGVVVPPIALAGRHCLASWDSSAPEATVVLTPDALRPDTPWVTDGDDYCLLAPIDQDTVHVSWTLTEEGNDARYSGEEEVPVAPALDALELYRSPIQTMRKD